MLPLHSPFYVEDLERTVLQCPEPDFFSSEEPMDLYYKILSVDADIERTADVTYPASSVFITFETEEMQRRVLKEMTHPKLSKSVVDSRYKFEGLVLEITEPDEPSSIRWKDLDELESVSSPVKFDIFSCYFEETFSHILIIDTDHSTRCHLYDHVRAHCVRGCYHCSCKKQKHYMVSDFDCYFQLSHPNGSEIFDFLRVSYR